MKIKRLFAFAVVLCLLIPVAKAENQESSLFDSIGEWIEQAWNDASKWISQAGQDTSSWAERAWGDASKWVEQAWNDSSKWMTDIWDNVSDWTAATYNSAAGTVSTWWTDTFNKVTETKNNIWEWIGKESQEVKEQIRQKYDYINTAARNSISDAEKKIQSTFWDLLKQLNLKTEDIQKVTETIKAYAAEKGISLAPLEEFLMPYLIQFALDAQAHGINIIPPEIVAQYLTGVTEKIGATTDDLVKGFIESLDAFFLSL